MIPLAEIDDAALARNLTSVDDAAFAELIHSIARLGLRMLIEIYPSTPHPPHRSSHRPRQPRLQDPP